MATENATRSERAKSVALDTPVYLRLRKRAFETFDDMKKLANRYINEGIERDETKEKATQA